MMKEVILRKSLKDLASALFPSCLIFCVLKSHGKSNLKETFIFIYKNILKHINSVLGCPLFLNDEPELIRVCS